MVRLCRIKQAYVRPTTTYNSLMIFLFSCFPVSHVVGPAASLLYATVSYRVNRPLGIETQFKANIYIYSTRQTVCVFPFFFFYGIVFVFTWTKGMNGSQQNLWKKNIPFGNILGSLFHGILLILKDFSILRFSHLYFIKTHLRKRKKFI